MRDAEVFAGALFDDLTATLRAASVGDSRREAMVLWRGVIGSRALIEPDSAVEPDAAAALREAGRRRALGEPVAHVIGSTGFRHLTIRCDRRALIPRPETEGLVDLALARVRSGVAADIGTGSGAIALSLRHEGGFDEVIGIDCSPLALDLAQENGCLSSLAVSWVAGDLVAPLAGRQLDLLVSNPPYLTVGEYAVLDRSVRDYEPELALPSGRDGLEATRRLLTEGRGVMRPGGWMVLELDCRRAGDSAAIARAAGWLDVQVHDDLFGRARYLEARRGEDA